MTTVYSILISLRPDYSTVAEEARALKGGRKSELLWVCGLLLHFIDSKRSTFLVTCRVSYLLNCAIVNLLGPPARRNSYLLCDRDPVILIYELS